jgi:hypothetical protein
MMYDPVDSENREDAPAPVLIMMMHEHDDVPF